MELIDKKILRIHNYIYANEGLSNSETLNEFLKIFYCKIIDENNNNAWLNLKSNIQIIELINNLFSELKNRLYIFFDKDEKINLKNETIVFVYNELRNIKLCAIDSDIKGHILQKIIDRSYRESRGQFFTPAPVVDFIVKMINPQPTEIGCDPACGTGGFMFSALEFIHKNNSHDDIIKNVYFCDISKAMIKLIAMRLMFEFSDIKGNYFIQDSITEDYINNFDYVLSNPPFGSQGKIINPTILSKYKMGIDQNGNILKSQVPDILFVEKIIKILKENGRAAIVLPDGDFENPSLVQFRKFLVENVKIDAIVSLPDGTFIPYGTGVKSSIIFITKLNKNKLTQLIKTNYNIFYGKITKLGYTFSKHSKNIFLPNGKLDEDYTEIFSSFNKKIYSDKAYLVPINDVILNKYILSESYHSPIYKRTIENLKKNNHVKLKDIVNFKYNKIKINKEDKYKYIEIADVNSYTSEIINYTELYGDELPSRASYVIDENDIIVATSGNSIGTNKQSKALVPKEFKGCVCTNGFTVMTPKKISPYYLLKFFSSNLFLDQMLKYKYGTAIPCVSREDFENILIAIPNENELKDIENKIKKAIELRQEAMNLFQD